MVDWQLLPTLHCSSCFGSYPTRLTAVVVPLMRNLDMFYTKEDMKDEKRSSWWEGWIVGLLFGISLTFIAFIGYGTYLEIAYPQ